MVKKLRLVPPEKKPERPRSLRYPLSPERAREIKEAAQREFWKDEASALELRLSIGQLMSLLEIDSGRYLFDAAWRGPLTAMQALLLRHRADLLEVVQIQELEALELIEIVDRDREAVVFCTEKGEFLAHWWTEHLIDILQSAPDTPSKSA